MAGPDTGTPQAPQLAAGGERREHAVTHRPPDTRHEHAAALHKGRYYLKITGTFVHFHFAVFHGFFIFYFHE